ncbi:hypothetical protein E4T42_01561 [Aureobasidium subglaciale]|nr:hypothetical protein E4T42_01561 [Aureobasidium subglaciale]
MLTHLQVYPAIWQGDHDQKYEVLEGFLSNSSTFPSFLWRSFTAGMHLHGQRSSGQAGYVRFGELTPLYDSSDQWIYMVAVALMERLEVFARSENLLRANRWAK